MRAFPRMRCGCAHMCAFSRMGCECAHMCAFSRMGCECAHMRAFCACDANARTCAHFPACDAMRCDANARMRCDANARIKGELMRVRYCISGSLSEPFTESRCAFIEFYGTASSQTPYFGNMEPYHHIHHDSNTRRQMYMGNSDYIDQDDPVKRSHNIPNYIDSKKLWQNIARCCVDKTNIKARHISSTNALEVLQSRTKPLVHSSLNSEGLVTFRVSVLSTWFVY